MQITCINKNPHLNIYNNVDTQDRAIRQFYKKLVDEGRLKQVFHDGSMSTLQEFTTFVYRKTWFYFGYDLRSMVGGIWFTDILEESCKIHICSFEGYRAHRFLHPIVDLLNIILDNSPNVCYKIIATTPYKGIARLFKHVGFVERNNRLELTK